MQEKEEILKNSGSWLEKTYRKETATRAKRSIKTVTQDVFYKSLNLQRRAQKVFKVNLVNVPIILKKISSVLPRTSLQGGINLFKLKRKLTYKGHHIHQNIRPYPVYQDLSWLRRNNILYKNVQIKTGNQTVKRKMKICRSSYKSKTMMIIMRQ